MDIDDIRFAVLGLIQVEAKRGQQWLRRNPRVIGRRLEKRVRPGLRDEFFAELHAELRLHGYQTLGALVQEEIVHYFRLAGAGGVEPRLCVRGGF